MAGFYDQAVKLLQTYSSSATGFAGPWSEAMRKNMKLMPQLAEGRPESFMHIFHNMFSALDDTFGKVFHVPAVGKDREKITLLLRAFDDLAVNMAKNIEYQHMLYATGMTAMERVIETIAHKIKSGEEVKSFDEFFDLWIDLNEKTYLELFQTEEFSQLQGEFMESTLMVRRHFFKLMELYLYDFPIALRSEMDDLYKTIYDLKKKLKSLEKQMKIPKGLSIEEVTA
jgi:class III poly(R)-hydroxyalkanoic acid synthase PhaE subunit